MLIRFTVAKIWGEFKHEVRQFEKSYDNQQAEQISLAYRKFKRPFRAVCWVGGGRASPVLGTDRTSVSGISASRGHAAALSAAMLR
ncbi:TPA: hypothetical protein L4936_006585 [Pseudomonas aeruginosa]|nr:hypothetical protein [Pseudomonas aeruginosa]HBO7223550.1 hypothetical protein [Pseudomonas aeruginosa]